MEFPLPAAVRVGTMGMTVAVVAHLWMFAGADLRPSVDHHGSRYALAAAAPVDPSPAPGVDRRPVGGGARCADAMTTCRVTAPVDALALLLAVWFAVRPCPRARGTQARGARGRWGPRPGQRGPPPSSVPSQVVLRE